MGSTEHGPASLHEGDRPVFLRTFISLIIPHEYPQCPFDETGQPWYNMTVDGGFFTVPLRIHISFLCTPAPCPAITIAGAKTFSADPAAFPGKAGKAATGRDGTDTRPAGKRFPRTAAPAYPSPTQPRGVLFTPFLSRAGGQPLSGLAIRMPGEGAIPPPCRAPYGPCPARLARGTRGMFFILTACPEPTVVPGHGGLPAARGCSRPRGAGDFPP